MAYNWRETAKETEDNARIVQDQMVRQLQSVRKNTAQTEEAPQSEGKSSGGKSAPQRKTAKAETSDGAIPLYNTGPGLSPIGGNGSTGRAVQFDPSKAPAYLDGIAQKYGINPDDFKRMAWIESKFDPNARAGSSSAGGLFQFTDDTARRYGLTNKFDGVANAEAAARLWMDNKAGLEKALGRAPTAGELYLAHQQGLGGATKLLTNPNASAESLLGSDAFRHNGGRDGMTGADFARLWTGKFEGPLPGATPHNGDASVTTPGNSAYESGLTNQYGGRSNGESQQCVALVKDATNVGHTSNWAPGTGIDQNTKPGTPIATFGPEGRYMNIPGQSHAAIYLGPGSQPGSIRVLDQWAGHQASVREIHPGDKAESAQNFRVIQTRDGTDPGIARAPHMNDQAQAQAIPTHLAADASSMSDANNDIRRAAPVSNSGTNPMASTATPAATTPSSTTPSTTRPMTDAEVVAAVGRGEHINYENGKAVTTSPGTMPTSGNGSTSTNPQEGGGWHAPMIAPGQDGWHAPMAAPSTTAIPTTNTSAPATTGAAAPAATAQAGQSNPFDEVGKFFSDLFNVGDNLRAPNGQDWDALYGYQTPPKEDAQGSVTTAGNSSAGEANNAQAELPDNNANASAPVSNVQSEDNGSDPAGGGLGGLGDTLGQIFSGVGGNFGFARGGAVPGYAAGGLVKGNRGRPDRVAASQPGVAIPTGDRGTSPGGGYSARRAVTPGYATGGYYPGQQNGEAPPEGPALPPPVEAAPVPEQPTTPASVDYPNTSGPTDSRGWNAGYAPPENPGLVSVPGSPDDVERIHQQHRREAMIDHDLMQQNANSYTFGGLLRNALHGVVGGVTEQYGLDKAAGQSQGQGIPQQGEDPLQAISNFFTGDHTGEAVTPDEMNKITKAVDPYGKLKEGLDKTAGLAATYKHYLEQGDINSANKAATAITWHLQGLSAQYGEQAYAFLKGGNTDAAVKALEKGYDHIPDGMGVRVNKQGDGTYRVEQYDVTSGKGVKTFSATPQDLLAASLGLKNGTAFWSAVTDAANNKKGGGVSPAFQEFEERSARAEGAAPSPSPTVDTSRPPLPNPDDEPDAPPSPTPTPGPSAAATPAQTAIPSDSDPAKVAQALAPKEGNSADILVRRQMMKDQQRLAGGIPTPEDGRVALAMNDTTTSDAPGRGRLPAPPNTEAGRKAIQRPVVGPDEQDIKTLKGSKYATDVEARQANEQSMAENDRKYSEYQSQHGPDRAIPWNAPRAYTPPSNNEVFNRYLNAEYKGLPKPPQMKPLYNAPDVSGMLPDERRYALSQWQKQNQIIKDQNTEAVKNYNAMKKAAESNATTKYKQLMADQKSYNEGLEQTNKPIAMHGGSMEMYGYPGDGNADPNATTGGNQISSLVMSKLAAAGVSDKDLGKGISAEAPNTIGQLVTWGLQHNPGSSPERVTDSIIKAVMPTAPRQGTQTVENMRPAQVVPLGDKQNRYRIVPSDPMASPIVVPAEALPMIGVLRAQMFKQATMSSMDKLHSVEASGRNTDRLQKAGKSIFNFFGGQ
jgi:hypothetical protein